MSKPISAIPSTLEFRKMREMPGRMSRKLPANISSEMVMEADPFMIDDMLVGRLQFAVQVRNSRRMPSETVGERMARMMHDHVYGGVVDELQEVKHELYSEGFTNDDPAYKRICDLIRTLREGGVQ